MTDFIRGEGLPFLAHLLKRLSDEFVRGCTEWYPEAGLRTPPRCASTIRALFKLGPLSVTQLAATIRQSHPLAINWVRELKNLGLIETTNDPEDGRRTLVRLTEAGLLEAERCIATDEVIARAYADLMQEADADVFDALWRMEALCRAVPFESRLRNASRDEND
jgi:DNA-binding MarR family transcriptional regulator